MHLKVRVRQLRNFPQNLMNKHYIKVRIPNFPGGSGPFRQENPGASAYLHPVQCCHNSFYLTCVT